MAAVFGPGSRVDCDCWRFLDTIRVQNEFSGSEFPILAQDQCALLY